MNVMKWALGLALALFTLAGVAFAQEAPPPDYGKSSPESHQPSAQSGAVGQSLEDTVLVRGTPEQLAALKRPPSGPRPFVMSDELTKVTRSQWVSHGWKSEDFDRMELTTQHFCSVTGGFIVHAADLAGRYAKLDPRVEKLHERYDKMAGDIDVASHSRTGANIFATILGFGVSKVTGGIVGAGAFGNEMQGQAWDKAMRLTRDAGMLTTDYDSLHGEFNIMSLEIYADYLGLVNGYCTEKYGH